LLNVGSVHVFIHVFSAEYSEIHKFLGKNLSALISSTLLDKFRNAMSETRNFPASIALVNDAALRRAHDHRFSRLERSQGRVAITALDRFFDLAHRIPQHRAATFVHFGAARDHARGFAG
jgi:hypothetical protein